MDKTYKKILCNETQNSPSSYFKTQDEILRYYWSCDPRFYFFKTMPYNAKCLDVGAKSGGILSWKEWLPPVRKDLRMFANDIVEGEHFKNFS